MIMKIDRDNFELFTSINNQKNRATKIVARNKVDHNNNDDDDDDEGNADDGENAAVHRLSSVRGNSARGGSNVKQCICLVCHGAARTAAAPLVTLAAEGRAASRADGLAGPAPLPAARAAQRCNRRTARALMFRRFRRFRRYRATWPLPSSLLRQRPLASGCVQRAGWVAQASW